MRLVIALGGNALLKRGEPMTAANQRENEHDRQARLVHGRIMSRPPSVRPSAVLPPVVERLASALCP